MQERRDLGITGTPTFFLNGELMRIQTYEDFLTQIAEAIEPTANFGGAADAATTAPSEVEFGI